MGVDGVTGIRDGAYIHPITSVSKMHRFSVILQTTLGLLLIHQFALTAYSASKFSNVRKLSAEWVKTQRQIAQEKNEWEEEKATLRNMIQLLSEEDTDLARRIEEAKKDVSQSDKEREKLRTEKETLQNIEKVVKSALAEQENKLLELVQWLPEPLKDLDANEGGIANLVEKIPEDPEKTDRAMTRRLQSILGITSIIDKFNNNVLVEHGAREIDGKTVNVTTLYFGLAGGFYVDGTGTRAGVLTPAKGGWKEEANNELAQELFKAVAIYEKTTAEEPRFFILPVKFLATVSE